MSRVLVTRRMDSPQAESGRLSHEGSCSVPLVPLLLQGHLVRDGLKPGESGVLVHGGGRSSGIVAIQIARANGAHVLTTVSAVNAAFVKESGCGRGDRFTALGRLRTRYVMDVVFDTVGGATLQRSWRVLKPGGRRPLLPSDHCGRQRVAPRPLMSS